MNHHHVRKIDESLEIIKCLGFSKKQQNVRSALTLLALLDIKPDDDWGDAKAPLCGITPMMEFFAKHYGKKYAPNSRETVRRHTVHQFLQTGLIVENPDRIDRPTNSGKTVYQITPKALQLMQTYGTELWEKHLKTYLSEVSHLNPGTYRRRDKAVSINLPSGKIDLSAGRHNLLVKDICSKFTAGFIRDPVPIYVGDTAKKFSYFDRDGLSDLGVDVNLHGKMPDVMIYDKERGWLFLIEAVTSHGPVDAKRRKELQKIFSTANAGVVYVTAFDDMASMRRYAADISWKTEVWVADNPDHMIHFDGERFMGPYG